MAEDEDGFLGGLEGSVQLGGQVVGAFFLFLEAAGAEFDQFFKIGAVVHHLGDHGIEGVGQLADFPWAAIAGDAGMGFAEGELVGGFGGVNDGLGDAPGEPVSE